MELRDATAREIRHAARVLGRAPGFSLITFATLALGLGAATAIFGMLDAVVIRPLPYAHADRLVTLASPVPKLKGQTRWGLARHEMFYFLDQGHSFENIGVYQSQGVAILPSRPGDASERATMVLTSASLFDVLGFRPSMGRPIQQLDNHSRDPSIAVIGNGYWQRHFGASRDVIGKTINVEGLPLTVVGVLPAGADLPDQRVDIWANAHVDSTTNYNNHTWRAIGRLKPGVTPAIAQRDLAPLTDRLADVYPIVYRGNFIKNTGFYTEVTGLRDAIVGPVVTRALWVLFGAVLLVLIIAAANVANLFLVRIESQRRDVALRTALGANRGRLAAQYLTESFMLSTTAGAAGIGLAFLLLKLFVALAPSELPRLDEIHVNGASAFFAIGVSVLVALTFGLLPLVSTRIDFTMLRDAGRGLTASHSRALARRALVVVQIALAVVLLAGAGLMVRTFQNLRHAKLGFAPDGVLTMDVSLPALAYKDATRSSLFFQQLADRVRQMPGVTSVGFTNRMPLLSGDWCTAITLEGPDPDAPMGGTCPPDGLVSPGYLEAMGIHVDGATLTWSGMDAHDGGIIVSRAFAEHHWPGVSPIGKRARFGGAKPPFYHVVGVADDVRGLGVEAPPPEYIYFPMLPIPDAPLWDSGNDMTLVARTSASDPVSLAKPIATAARQLESQVLVEDVQTLDRVVAHSEARRSFAMALLAIAAGIALLLSAVGVYGVISYIVHQRRGEIGVRIALGASVPRVVAMVLRQSVSWALAGVGLGLVGAVALTRLLQALLYGVAPTDPLTLAALPLLLLLVVLGASLVPARRASRIDPVEALRSE